MHCTILAIGSRGDVQPLIALGVGLKNAGYEVRIATHADFEAFVKQHDLEYFQLTGNAARFYGGPAAAALRDRSRKAGEFLSFFQNYLSTFLDKLLIGCWEASQDTDCLLCWSWTRAGPSLAERLGIPVFMVGNYPVIHFPTRAFPNPYQGSMPVDSTPEENLLSWQKSRNLTRVGQDHIDRWRQQTLGLAPISWEEELAALQQLPHLLGFSPAVLPKPPDWPEWVYITGYWLLDAPVDYTPPPELTDFLSSRPAPVAIGFSSQIRRDARRINQIVIEALAQAEQSGIIIAGWSRLKGIELPETIFRIRFVPYDWLFPHVAAMVHQGGSGSAAMALRAGVPNMAVPFGYEQELWGRQIAAQGAGVAPILPGDLTPERLAEAIRRLVEDEAIRHHAARLSATLRVEDGVGTAVQIIKQILAGQKPSVQEDTSLRPAY
ncbi:MAG: glycosyltransferase [Candidatus Promineifilaceae bacterium]|nr:glycosyltransferase [Candidatus Promineifilaceae bacterium]